MPNAKLSTISDNVFLLLNFVEYKNSILKSRELYIFTIVCVKKIEKNISASKINEIHQSECQISNIERFLINIEG